MSEDETSIDNIPESRFVRNLEEEEVSLIDFLSRRGYGSVFIAGFMGAINSMSLSPDKSLTEISKQGFVDAPTQGMIRKYLDGDGSKVSIYRRTTPSKMKEYIDLNSMSFDLYDTFQALKGRLDDNIESGLIEDVDATRLARVLRELYETLQKSADEGRINQGVKTQYNIMNIINGIGDMVSPECSAEVDAVLQKHIKLKHMKDEAIDVDGNVQENLG